MIHDEVKSEGFRRAIPMADGIYMEGITVDDAERMWLLGYDTKIDSGRVIDFNRASTGRAGRVRRVSDGQLYTLGEKGEIPKFLPRNSERYLWGSAKPFDSENFSRDRLLTPNEIQDIADKLTTKEILTPNEMRALYGVDPLDGTELKTYLNKDLTPKYILYGRGSGKSRERYLHQKGGNTNE